MASGPTNESLLINILNGEYYMGPPDPFYDSVKNVPAPSESGEKYKGDITALEVAEEQLNTFKDA